MSVFNSALFVINEVYADEYVKQHMTPLEVTKALADAGLLAPEPQIIRAAEELAALDPDTVLAERRDAWGDTLLTAFDWLNEWGDDADDNPTLAVIATGDHVRAARQALEATE